jgi:hypothetical protein
MAKSYRYLRIVMVGLVVAIAVAVFYQSWRQGSFLASVSAYYYTPAQAIFVGALIGLGACMIALKGVTEGEDIFLNVGGVFAAGVAIVPATRGADYQTAVQACQRAGSPLLTQRASEDLDCPTVQALADATRANVENNMVTLLVVGFLAIVAAVVFLRRDRTSNHWVDGSSAILWGFVAVGVVWLGGLIALSTAVDWFIDNAHYLAAAGLFLCILSVAVENARRHQKELGSPSVGKVLTSPPAYRYTWIAVAMLVVAAIAVVMKVADVISLFWLEIAVAALFAAFWTVQTIELEPPRPQRPSV